MDNAINVDMKEGPGIVVANASSLPFKDGTFAEAHSINPYGFFPVSQETARVLKPGGLLIVTGTMNNRYAKPMSAEAAKARGFELIETRPMIEEHTFGTPRHTTGVKAMMDNAKTTIYRKLP